MSTADPSAPSPLERHCPFITFYSFKGGVGRSMALINVAGILAARGFRVLIIDMDLEAPGISYLVNQLTDDHKRLQPGLVDILLDAVERGPEADLFALPANAALGGYLAHYELPDGFARSPGAALSIMLAGRLDDHYSDRLERLDLPGLYRDGQGVQLTMAFKQIVQESGLFDYVFVDSRTGFSDESGICTRDLADSLVVLSGLNKQNIEGTAHFLKALRAATSGECKLEVVLSPIPNGEDGLVDARTKDAQNAYSDAWGSPITCDLQIPYHPQLALTEEPHIFRRRKGYLYEAYCGLEVRVRALTGDIPSELCDAALDAFKSRRFDVSLARLRRASLLADTHNWLDKSASSLVALGITQPEAHPIYEFLGNHVSEPTGVTMVNTLLWRASKTPNARVKETDEILRAAVLITPDDPDVYAECADLLRKKRGDPDTVQSYYERAIEIAPCNPTFLGNYAGFLWDERRDPVADGYFKRAIAAAPEDVDNLSNYASFLLDQRKDLDIAESFHQRAYALNPSDDNNLANYGRLHLILGRNAEGLELVERVLEKRLDARPHAIDAECWMYIYCCAASERRADALHRLHKLVTEHAIKTGNWDFSGVITRAQVTNHPEAARLPDLAAVLAGTKSVDVLADWAPWHAATRFG